MAADELIDALRCHLTGKRLPEGGSLGRIKVAHVALNDALGGLRRDRGA